MTSTQHCQHFEQVLWIFMLLSRWSYSQRWDCGNACFRLTRRTMRFKRWNKPRLLLWHLTFWCFPLGPLQLSACLRLSPLISTSETFPLFKPHANFGQLNRQIWAERLHDAHLFCRRREPSKDRVTVRLSLGHQERNSTSLHIITLRKYNECAESMYKIVHDSPCAFFAQ